MSKAFVPYSAEGAELITFDFFFGHVQSDQTEFDGWGKFAQSQIDSYAAKGVADPTMGAFEALGLTLATSYPELVHFDNFDFSKPGNVHDFVVSEYAHIFDRLPGAEQIAHFEAQFNYFDHIYSGLTPDAEIRAAGAVLGQMLGVAAQEGGNLYHDAVADFATAPDQTILLGRSLVDIHSGMIG